MIKRVANIDLKDLKLEILEKQIEIAFVLKDYWQALSIFEQIQNPTENLLSIREQIKNILKY